MTVTELAGALSLKPLAGEGGMGREVRGCYVGDLLSWVMGRAGEDNMWVTVMGNVNGIAVAKLADISCVVLCDSAALDEGAKAQADINDIPVLVSEQPAYELAVAFSRLAD